MGKYDELHCKSAARFTSEAKHIITRSILVSILNVMLALYWLKDIISENPSMSRWLSGVMLVLAISALVGECIIATRRIVDLLDANTDDTFQNTIQAMENGMLDKDLNELADEE